MVGDFKRFDSSRRPIRQWRVLSPLMWLIAFPKTFAHRARIDKTGMPKGLKKQYFMLCNHNSFMDFKVMVRAIFPRRANYIVSMYGFVHIEWLLRAIGSIGHRKFSRSVAMVRNMLHVRDMGGIMILYPEARYSLCGTTAVLPESLGKMVRRMNLPVVTLIMHGHHINSPVWNGGNRKVKPVESEMRLLLTKEETQELSLEEINARIVDAFQYDDYSWQKEKNVRVKYKRRAEGLHKVLYQCPSCHAEYKMATSMNTISCGECGKVWEMSELGELQARTGETEFSHIPSWYEWQRANVRREVEDGTYSFSAVSRIESLPNSKGFVRFEDKGRLTHNMNGFTLTGVFEGEPFEVCWAPESLYSCHIEYNFKNWGDCVDLSNNDDTFYVFPEGCEFSVTKIVLATEEMYSYYASKDLSEDSGGKAFQASRSHPQP